MEKDTVKPFPILDQLKHINKQKQEFWSAHQLAAALGYANYRSFTSVIKRAKLACKNSGYHALEHFKDTTEKFIDAKGRKRIHTTTQLSRYASYLIIQNAHPNKPSVALGQTYFAIQTRKQELLALGESAELTFEEQSRLLLRNEITQHNKRLAELARSAGVVDPKDFSAFQNQGYRGLYGGLDREHLHHKKGLKKNQKVLDYMGSTELAANLFRATQTEEKLKRDNIHSKLFAYKVHYDIGKKVRDTIADLGGTMPESLPTPHKGIQYLERKQTHGSEKNLPQLFLREK
jgi:DNA-damage-inducible protein D